MRFEGACLALLGLGLLAQGKEYILRLRDEEATLSLSSSSLLGEGGVSVRRRLERHPLLLVEGSETVLPLLRGAEGVLEVEENYPLHLHSLYVQEVNDLWHLDDICKEDFGLDNGKYLYNFLGTDVSVYVFDTGINLNHVDFQGRASRFRSYTDSTCPDDCNGHGTHVAGTVGGAVHGIAKNVSLHDVQVMNDDGVGSIFTLVEALYDVADSIAKTSIGVMSLGGTSSSVLKQAIRYARERGLFIAASAGNSNKDACFSSPGDSDDVIAVAAHDKEGAKADFSNYGPCVEVYAPGVSIKSTYFGSPTAVKTLSGTSMAAPIVAGIMATMLEQNPYLTFDLAVRVLTNQTKHSQLKLDRPAATSVVYASPCSSFCTSEKAYMGSGVGEARVPSSFITPMKRGVLTAWLYFAEVFSPSSIVFELVEMVQGVGTVIAVGESRVIPISLSAEVNSGSSYQLRIRRTAQLTPIANFLVFYEEPVACSAASDCSSNGNCAEDGSCICFEAYYGDDCSENIVSFLMRSHYLVGGGVYLLAMAISGYVSRMRRRANRVDEMSPLLYDQ